MGVFSTRNAINESYEEVDLLDESIDITGTLDIEAGGMGRLIAENEINYTAMMKMIGICELAAIEESGDAIYEASDVSGFFGKIKEFFKNILEKIKRLFKNFLVKFDAFTKSGKDFVTKYKKQLIAAKTKDLDFEGFKFTIDNNVPKYDTVTIQGVSVPAAADNFMDAIEDEDPEKIAEYAKKAVTDKNAADLRDALDTIDDKYDDLVENMRAGMLGKTGSFTAEEYSEELFKLYRNNEDKKETLDDSYINVTNLMATMINYEKCKKEVDKAYKEIDKGLNKFMNRLDKAENKLLKEAPGEKDADGKVQKNELISISIRGIALANRFVKDHQNLWTQKANAHLRALKDEAQQAKAICAKLLTRKPTKESADLDDGEAFGVTHGSAFDNLKLI